MTILRHFLGWLLLMHARLILYLGTHLANLAWWIMDREDVIAAQKAVTACIAKELDSRRRP